MVADEVEPPRARLPSFHPSLLVALPGAGGFATTPRLALWLLVALLTAAPRPALAQIFFASQPAPGLSIGPLIIRATVSDEPGPVPVHILWSVIVPANRRPEGGAKDLYLLWPGEVRNDGPGEAPDPALTRYVGERGFSVIAEGHVGLFAQSLAETDTESAAAARPIAGGASFVTFVQAGGALGLSPPATLIRIPWTSRLTDREWLMDLLLHAQSLVKPKKEGWVERVFLGPHYRVTLRFNEVRERPLFAMYFAHRDRLVPLADAPGELMLAFRHSDRLKIDEVVPPTAIRRMSETMESTQMVSLFLDASDGLTPQQLAVQFGYFSKVQGLTLLAIPVLFFALGQALSPVINRTTSRITTAVTSRVHLAEWADPRRRPAGVILARETLEKIVPGTTTREEVIRLCGADFEEKEHFPGPHRSVLVYRGRRLVPEARRLVGWLSTVRRWEVERHEVRIELEQDIVRDVQAEIRRYRLTPEEAA